MNLFFLDWFFVHQILGIVKSQIEMEKIFSLIKIFTNLRYIFCIIEKFREVDICEKKIGLMGESSIKWITYCVFFGSNYKYHKMYHKFFNYVIIRL